MRPFLASILLAVTCLSPARAESFDPLAVDFILQDALKFWSVPGCAVAIIRDDQVIYLKGHGVKELGRAHPVTPDTLFPIGSCTKGFTTTAMAMLVDEGKMSWDDPVRKHIPYFHLADPLADAKVTLRDLVTHRAGVGSNDLLWYRSPWTQEEIIRRLAYLKPAYPFRSGFEYQTSMFTTAGNAVAAASGQKWEDFVRSRILEPLGMKDVALTTPAALASPDHATPHRLNSQEQVDVIPWYPFPIPEPAGSVSASARDLARWLRFHLGDGTFEGHRLVSAKNLQETHTPQVTLRLEGNVRKLHPQTNLLSYGMAWVVEDYRGHLLVSHAGLIDGFRAQLTLLPKEHIGIVILANLHETRMNLATSNTLVDLLLGVPRAERTDWNRHFLQLVQEQIEAAQAKRKARDAKRQVGTKPSRELAAYAGSYEDPAYGTVRIALESGKLVWRWNNFATPLEHFHYDTFLGKLEGISEFQVVFNLGADGEVDTMKVLDIMDVDFRRAGSGLKK